jgi:UDP:flavonoid glycosyltransferase YjiC (YdhE family)
MSVPQPTPPNRPRILFVAEAVTLAHVARPTALAQTLDPECYEAVLACDRRYDGLLAGLPLGRRAIHSLSSARFLQALAEGRPVYDSATLRCYVEEDLQLLDEVRPAVVVGDFRLSLSVSARRAGVPYLTITNAYWSPYARQRFPVPDLPLTRRLGLWAGGLLFRLARPVGFALHTRPLNRVRRFYGLPSLGLDLRRIYTEADLTLYADVLEMFPTFALPANHHYLGPILWSPPVPLPAWWNRLPADRPIVYVTLGSSGPPALMSVVLEGLAGLPVIVTVATAGQKLRGEIPANTFVADYLPGGQVVGRARLVICNGGSPTTQQALAAGVPVLGLPSNLDQYLNMEGVERHGAGVLLRGGTADAGTSRAAVLRLLNESHYAEAAQALARTLARYDAPGKFRELLARLCSTK